MQALSPRERQVILLLARGYTRIAAAAELGLSFSTINTHAHNAYGKLGVHNANQLLLACTQRGLLDPRDSPERTDELELLTKVLAHTRSLIAALDDGRRPRRRHLTLAQTKYLAALDVLLAARHDPGARDAARAQMAAALEVSPGQTGRPRNAALAALIADVLDS